MRWMACLIGIAGAAVAFPVFLQVPLTGDNTTMLVLGALALASLLGAGVAPVAPAVAAPLLIASSVAWLLLAARGTLPFDRMVVAAVLLNEAAGLLAILAVTRAPARERATASAYGEPPPAEAVPFNETKWATMLVYDEELAALVERLKPYGDRWVKEFASSYITIRNRDYMPMVFEKTMKRIEEELRQGPMVVEEGTHRGRKFRRFHNGEVEAQIGRGKTSRFPSFDAFANAVR